ncbi:hypothetical protein FG386_001508 [Cryptosporidium ryanae]|uniref:uncharacterized protein n=1 Tax=Cryptosporidium ryanae TaxID=515981 RepID=UPI00351A7F6F|nr:hypothetical protein FG386_001508 [Cryptosporidium ryanae]
MGDKHANSVNILINCGNENSIINELINSNSQENIEISVDNEASNYTSKSVFDYCKDKLDEMYSFGTNKCVFDLKEDEKIVNFKSQVDKMRIWPSFDHIFRAARKDNKWFLKSVPLKRVNKILIKEQSLINISKVS